MTADEYKKIVAKLYAKKIDPPEDLMVKELALWIDGYSVCFKSACDILYDAQKQDGCDASMPVRCKDCKYFVETQRPGIFWCSNENGPWQAGDDDFCSRAEKKSDG